MSNRSNETIWPVLIFFGTWWAFTNYALFEQHAFFCAIALWFVGVIATRMFSSTVHQLGFWGWVRLLEVTAWYALALCLVPLEPVTTILLLWGVATPLLFVGNVWRRTYERFAPIQSLMRGALIALTALAVVALPVLGWRFSGFVLDKPGVALVAVLGAALALFYGWRLAAPTPTGQYDARIGSFETFKRRGMSGER